MNCFTICLTVGMACLAATAADAADWNNGAGGIKDHGGLAGVPVPAPVPVMESFSWYLRSDLGFAVKSRGGVSTTTALGATIDADYDTNEGPFHGSLGFGRYMTPNLRWDFLVDYRGDQHVRSGNTFYEAITITNGAVVTDPVSGNQVQSHQINTYHVNRAEEVRVANHTALFNMYYDFNRGGGFNPYVGLGAGLTARVGKVEFNERAICAYTTNDLGVPPFPQGCTEPEFNKAGKPSQVNFGLAAALMTGFTYEISQGVLIDTGYRLAWQGGNTTIKPAGSGDVISAGSRTDHEIRAGLRWNVW